MIWSEIDTLIRDFDLAVRFWRKTEVKQDRAPQNLKSPNPRLCLWAGVALGVVFAPLGERLSAAHASESHCAALARDYSGENEHQRLLQDCAEADFDRASPIARLQSPDGSVWIHGASQTLYFTRAGQPSLISGAPARLGRIAALAYDSVRDEVAVLHDLGTPEHPNRLIHVYNARINGVALPGRVLPNFIADGASALAFDVAQNRLWVLRSSENAIAQYSRLANSEGSLDDNSIAERAGRIRGEKTRLQNPSALAVDQSRGELFVANAGADEILVFAIDAEGDSAPVRVLSGPQTGLRAPAALRLTTDGQMIIENRDGSVVRFSKDASGNASPL